MAGQAEQAAKFQSPQDGDRPCRLASMPAGFVVYRVSIPSRRGQALQARYPCSGPRGPPVSIPSRRGQALQAAREDVRRLCA